MTLQLFFVKSEVCSQKRLTWVKNRMLSFRSRYQILTMARENVGKSGFLFRRVHKDDESARKHQEKLNTGPKIKASLIRRSATDNCFTCCRLWSEILISYVRAANICLITSDFNWRRKASDGLRFLWKVLDQMKQNGIYFLICDLLIFRIILKKICSFIIEMKISDISWIFFHLYFK